MKSILVNMLQEIRYAVVLLTSGGLKAFLKQLKRQIYSKDIRIGFELNLQEVTISPIESSIRHSLQLASKEDMDEVLQSGKTESKEVVHWLIYGKWLFDCGFRHCFLARTMDSNEPCYLHFVIHPGDLKLVNKYVRNRFPKLEDDEILLEGAYTFEKYKGNRLAGSTLVKVLEIYREQGFKRAIGYISRERTHINRLEKLGFKRFEEETVMKIILFTSRRAKPYQQPAVS